MSRSPATSEVETSPDASVKPSDAGALRPLLVSIEGAAEILAIGRTSVYQLVWNEELEPIRIGRCLRFPVEQLEQFVARKALQQHG